MHEAERRNLELATVVCNRGIPRVLGILSSLLSLCQLLLQLRHFDLKGELLLQCLALLQERRFLSASHDAAGSPRTRS